MSPKSQLSNDLIWESPSGPELASGGFTFGRRSAGALVGLLLAGVYSLVAATIDALVLRDVPIRVDWPAIWLQVTTGALGGAALGLLTAWPETGWQGVLAGAAGFIAWYFLQGALRLQSAMLLLLPLFLPLMVMCLPVALLLRWLVSRQSRLDALAGWPRWRGQLLVVALIAAAGGVAGSWAQMPPTAQEAVRRVQRILNHAFSEPAGALLPAALRGVPDIRQHAASAYSLDQRAVPGMSAQIDVRVTFADGYQISCAVDTQVSWVVCRPGADSLYGGAVYDPNDQR